MMEVVTSLLDGTVVRDVDADDIRDIIQDGKQASIDAVEKSKKLSVLCVLKRSGCLKKRLRR